MLLVRIIFVFLLLLGFSAAENETASEAIINTSQASLLEPAESTATEPVTTAVTDAVPGLEEADALPDLVEVSDVIFNECNCTDGTVDCSSRDLSRPFEAEDWNGLQTLGILEVTNVDLSNNQFVALPQFPALPIRRLNLSNCEIEILEDAVFSNLKYLTILDLSRNRMSFVVGKRAFMGVSEKGMRPMPFMDLQQLSLAYNDIHSLSQDVFMFMPHLTFLDLSGNPLVSIDQVTMGALVDLIRLKELRISECELESLPTGIFRRLRSLRRLDLSQNSFTVVPKALSGAVNLQYLNFNMNPIQNISERTAISNLTKLQELHLCRHTKLRSIAQGALGGLESLVKLHMNYNPRLTILDPRFLEWEDELGIERSPLLEELYLNNNNISEVDSRLLKEWDHLTHVDFSANPYVCDCNNQWMVDVLVPLIMGMANAAATKMVCRKPYDYRGLTFSQLYESRKTLPCAVSESVTDGTGVETAVLYGVLIGMMISFPIVMVVVILWKKGYFARCRKKMNSPKDYFDDEENDAF